MLSILLFLPAATGLVLLALPGASNRTLLRAWVGISAVEVGLAIALWIGFVRRDHPGGGVLTGIAQETNVQWIPSVGSGYHIGVDGLSLPLVALTAVLFLACAIYALREDRRVRSYVVLFLFLETVCLGVFVALDLILFFVFFDLSIVGMYFVIAGWGHGQAQRAALKFFLYTFTGSLALLLGFIGLYVASDPHTFDMVALARQLPLAGQGWAAGLVLLALGVGFAIKTPTVPFHTWLPPAHTEAPATGSVILAGVMLKMGTYGFLRIMMPILSDTWRRYAWIFVIVGVVSVLYGALVALAQSNFKRMIAYTSVNHMGYILLAVGSAGLLAHSDAQARQLAVTGAVTQLAATMPRFAGLTAVAAFASLGLPGFSGFIAEFQIFTGALPAVPVATGFAFFGILLTAALFLVALQRVFLGPPREPQFLQGGDTTAVELTAIVSLLVLSVVIGVFPRFLLDVIEPASRVVVDLVAR